MSKLEVVVLFGLDLVALSCLLLVSPSEHEEGLVRLAEVSVRLSSYSPSRVSVVKWFNRFLLSRVKHNVNHILNILEALVLKMEHYVANELLLSPNEENAILHDFRRNDQLFEIFYRCSTESLAALIWSVLFLFLLLAALEHLFAMVSPLGI